MSSTMSVKTCNSKSNNMCIKIFSRTHSIFFRRLPSVTYDKSYSTVFSEICEA